MITVDGFFSILAVFALALGMYMLGAVIHGGRVQRDALKEKEWILANTVFKQTFMAELRALEVDAQGVLALHGSQILPAHGSSHEYWDGKLQAFRDVIVKLGGKIYV